MDCIVHGVTKSWTRLSDFHFKRSLQENQKYQGTFHAKMCTKKDKNSMDLKEAEDIRRGGKNTQKSYAKKTS